MESSSSPFFFLFLPSECSSIKPEFPFLRFSWRLRCLVSPLYDEDIATPLFLSFPPPSPRDPFGCFPLLHSQRRCDAVLPATAVTAYAETHGSRRVASVLVSAPSFLRSEAKIPFSPFLPDRRLSDPPRRSVFAQKRLGLGSFFFELRTGRRRVFLFPLRKAGP